MMVDVKKCFLIIFVTVAILIPQIGAFAKRDANDVIFYKCNNEIIEFNCSETKLNVANCGFTKFPKYHSCYANVKDLDTSNNLIGNISNHDLAGWSFIERWNATGNMIPHLKREMIEVLLSLITVWTDPKVYFEDANFEVRIVNGFNEIWIHRDIETEIGFKNGTVEEDKKDESEISTSTKVIITFSCIIGAFLIGAVLIWYCMCGKKKCQQNRHDNNGNASYSVPNGTVNIAVRTPENFH